MSYIVWLHVENDDDADSAPQKAWWSVRQFASLARAIGEAETIAADYAARTGIVPERLEDDTE